MASHTYIETFASYLFFFFFFQDIKNSDKIIHRVTQQNTEQLKQNNYAFSLDVISLYTTAIIYLHTQQSYIRTYFPELILSQTNSNRYTPTIIHCSRQYLLHLQRKYLQISGLPMGSSISGILER